MTARVLVTRPEPGASRTAARLRALGIVPVVLPLSRTVPLPVEPLPALFDAVLATSANALRHAPDHLVQGLSGLPLLAIGGATATAARQRGFRAVTSADGSAADLVQLLTSMLAPPARLAYLTGRIRLPHVERALAEGLYRATPVETYDTMAVSYADDEISRQLGREPMTAAMIYSALAADGFEQLRSAAAGDLCRDAWIISISDRVAERLRGTDATRIRVARMPNEEAMMDTLSQTLEGVSDAPLF
jgi:uroporphyrinogen-III synthase